MDRLERLLRMGYLPSQVPPSFKTIDLASHQAALLAAWDAFPLPKNCKEPKSPSSRAETFSVARAGIQRRVTSVPNPVAQTYLSRVIVNNWAKIVHHYRRSKISASHPRFRRDSNRAASLPAMQGLYERRLFKGAGYRFVLRTDISRFFPTVYTHSIPWAIHGKSVAKKNRKITPKYYGNLLDQCVRQCQDEQTFGLPIGPDTSHIIAECIATAIDLDFSKRFRTMPTGFRYVDDYYLFFETLADAETALARLVRSLKDFELQINFAKTTICRVEELEQDSWTHALRSIAIASDGKRQRSDLNHYFERARELSRRHTDDSVMVYALRRAGRVIVRKENWDLFEAHVCLVASAHPVTLQTVARLLSTYRGLGYPIGKVALSRLANSLLCEHAPLEHHSEVAWCLWICKELDLDISETAVNLVAEMNSSICGLILLDMDASGKLPKSPPTARWKPLEKPEALWDDLWMLSYEAGVRGWGGLSDAHIKADPHFNELWMRNVRFYDTTTASLPPLIVPKPGVDKLFDLEAIANLLQRSDVETFFDHADDEDQYGSPLGPVGDGDEDQPF